MTFKRKTLLLLPILAATALLHMRFFGVHLTPRAAFDDACLGAYGRTLTPIGTYEAGRIRFCFCQDGTQIGLWTIEGINLNLWHAAGNEFPDLARYEGSVYASVSYFSPADLDEGAYAYAIRLDPAVETVRLRLDLPSGASWELEPSGVYGDIFFWYLPDCIPGQSLNSLLSAGYSFAFQAIGADGTALAETFCTSD